MKLLINILAIILIAVIIGLQFRRTQNLYKKKYDEHMDELEKQNNNAKE
ncbi:MAG: hypothetical protein PUB04_08865 [Clostridia bacterium]|nr:hypothetical protein [Clostridia bacterium]MDY4742965.1 hypothetical protein [Lachnospira sp.]